MRWMWVDRILELVPGQRIVTVKNVAMSEDHLIDHFPADPSRGLPALPVMPASLVLEGMAQTAGILVGKHSEFREKVVLAKIGRAEITRDPGPGTTIRYTATLDRIDAAGASTSGVIELMHHGSAGVGVNDPGKGEFFPIGRADMMFAHADNNMSGLGFPEHNFVFSDAFRNLLRSSGIEVTF